MGLVQAYIHLVHSVFDDQYNYRNSLFNPFSLACFSLSLALYFSYRNNQGMVLAALSKKIAKPPTVEILELLVARRAVSFTTELGFTNFVCEGEFESVV